MPEYCKFVNEPLPYPFEAMEPYIDIQTMYLHHDKHLQAYIDKLNSLIHECTSLQAFTYSDSPVCGFDRLKQILCNPDAFPDYLKTAIKNNAGGVFNHWFYFNGLSPQPDQRPQGTLAENIHWKFGSYSGFQKEFTKAAMAVFGSGYAWLTADAQGNLEIIQTANQDTPLAQNLVPVVCVDVWEHAYYLKHKNLRDHYLADWFSVVNWDWAQWCYENPKMFLEQDD